MHIFTVIYVLLSLKFGFIYKDQFTILGFISCRPISCIYKTSFKLWGFFFPGLANSSERNAQLQ